MQDIGLKHTNQWQVITQKFSDSMVHMTADDVLYLSRKDDEKISLATVYRTLHLLRKCDLAKVYNFSDRLTRFEPKQKTKFHYDHLICGKCAQIIEFCNDEIEQLQEKVAKKNSG